MHTEQIKGLLLTVMDRAAAGFSGIGIIISDVPQDLPITPLRPTSQLAPSLPTIEALLAISDRSSEFHDGFQVLSTELQLKLVSQYFSPRIAPLTFTPRDRVVGGRYVAALFGSALPGVVATGVVSASYGLAVFVGGAEVAFTAPKKVRDAK